MNLSRMIQQWGLVPMTYLAQMLPGTSTYGYVGSEDLTMYPLLLPGTFVQIDEKKSKIQEGPWGSEYERPIYFVETREGFVCSWCSLSEDKLILQPHSLSPVAPRAVRHPQRERSLRARHLVVVQLHRVDRAAAELVVPRERTEDGREKNAHESMLAARSARG